MDTKILRNSGRHLGLVLLFFMIVATLGCIGDNGIGDGELTAEDIRSKSVDAMNGIESYTYNTHIAMILDVNELAGEGDESDVMEMNMTGNGRIDFKNKRSYMEMNIGSQGMEMSTETYILDDTQYTKTFGIWIKNKTSSEIWDKQNLARLHTDVEGAEIELMGAESVDGVECYVLRTKPDLVKLIESMNQQMTGTMSDMSEDQLEEFNRMIKEVEMKAWIRKDNYLISKLVTYMMIDDEGNMMEMNTIITFSNYNTQVEIELPEAAKAAVSMDSMMMAPALDIPDVPDTGDVREESAVPGTGDVPDSGDDLGTGDIPNVPKPPNFEDI